MRQKLSHGRATPSRPTPPLALSPVAGGASPRDDPRMRGKASKTRSGTPRSTAKAGRKPHAEVKPRRSSRPPRTEADASRPIAYEVKVNGNAPSGFRPLSGKRPTSTRACHEIVTGSEQPCIGCPALLLAKSSPSRRETTVLASTTGPYRVASAEAMGQGRFLIHIFPLSESTVAALQRARVDRTARKAKLSDRELGVLELLLLGRSSADIGGALGITERTVRFHVANVLGKLQADSRADLLRLLL